MAPELDGYGESTSKCPACGGTVDTPADAAAHKCPMAGTNDPTREQIITAEAQTKADRLIRSSIRPTQPALQADARKLAQAVIDGWDQEVECIVILVPRGTTDNMAVARFLFGEHSARQKKILKHVLANTNATMRKL